MPYTELQVTSNFSFLRGAAHPEELVVQAKALGYSAIALSDHNTLAGIVRAHVAAKANGIRLIPGACLNLMNGPSLLAYPTSKTGYANLSALLSLGNLRTEKGHCLLYKEDVFQHAADIIFILLPPDNLNASFDFDTNFKKAAKEYAQVLGQRLYLGASCSYQGDDSKKLFRLSQLSEALNIPMVALNDVYYHTPERRELQDIITCIREKCTIQQAGYRLNQNAERYLKPSVEMERLFRKYPSAIQNTQEVANACQFSLDSLEYVYPEEITQEGRTPQEELERLTRQGLEAHFGQKIPKEVQATIDMELAFIRKKNYAAYFLTVHDFVRFAREQKILCQGRGSAANSAVCYYLGITSVDPTKFKLLFARFMSDARDEPPDIDVDFEHERREEVIQYIYQKYGRDRAGIVATVTQLHGKGAVRDVGKAMGLSVDAINRLSKSLWELDEAWESGQYPTDCGFKPDDPLLRKVLALTRQFKGFPRQLGQHTGGFVITQGKLSELCPILNARMENRTNIEWNKDDIEALGFLKVDVLALGMLSCIRKCFDLTKAHYQQEWTLASIPQDDPKVYTMVSRADTLGVFQIESRAQMTMLPRLRPQCFYDLVIEVALVRPGPIQGDMVHPYLRRRNGEEPVEYPSQELKEILGRTLGVPLFQEQAMEIAIVAAGFTPAEADALRRSMATFKAKGLVSQFQEKLVQGMVRRGYEESFAQRVFKQLEGFGSYGFPESHAASFALLVYVSAWLKCYYPDVFAAALLNSMPMGFYQPAQIVQDAKKHGVTVRAVDVNYSHWDNILEEKSGAYYALRLGFRQISGMPSADAALIVSLRQQPIKSLQYLKEMGLSQASLELLATADAFQSLGLSRRQALWDVAALKDIPIGLYQGQASESQYEAEIALPEMSLPEQVIQDYSTTSLSLKAHPISFLREQMLLMQMVSANNLTYEPNGKKVKVAGLVLVRQRPSTASGVCFITLEDETGVINIIVFPKLFARFRKAIMFSTVLLVEGRIQREGTVTHVIASRCADMTGMLQQAHLSEEERNALPKNQKAKEEAQKKWVQGEIFFGGRNFK
ncbi:MAG: error-prone DNA polymerase [Bacteroidetes bacterium]|nr:error-prone DNA polymerase [Bacteroidota bacterium]